MKRKQPNPGSPEAVTKGCKCPILDNANGKGYMGSYADKDGGPVFVMMQNCPLHGKKLTQPKKPKETTMKSWTRSNSMIRRMAVQDPGKAAAEIIFLQESLANAEESSANAGHHWREEKKKRIKAETQVARMRKVANEWADYVFKNHPGDSKLSNGLQALARMKYFKMCGESKEVAHGTASCELPFGHEGSHKAFGGWRWMTWENDKSCK